MTTRAAVRRSLLNALLDLERVDDAALDEAIRWVTRATFALFDLRGTHAPCEERSDATHSTPRGQEGSDLGAALSAPNVREGA